MSAISSKFWCLSSGYYHKKLLDVQHIHGKIIERVFSGFAKRTSPTRIQTETCWLNKDKGRTYILEGCNFQNSCRRMLYNDKLNTFKSSALLGYNAISFDSNHCKLPHFTKDYRTSYQQCKQYCTVKGQKEQRKQMEESGNKIKETMEKENVFTVPNGLTMTRIALTPFLGYLVLQEHFSVATGIFLVAGITDLLDGYIARNFKNQTTAFGSFLDPLADKLLVSVLYITLSMVHLIPVPLAVLVIARDVLLITAAFYVRFISVPPPRTLSSYFNATKVSAELKPLFISKINTALQLLLVAVSLTAPVFDFVNHPALQLLWYSTAATTVASGVGYMFAKGTFKELAKKAA